MRMCGFSWIMLRGIECQWAVILQEWEGDANRGEGLCVDLCVLISSVSNEVVVAEVSRCTIATLIHRRSDASVLRVCCLPLPPSVSDELDFFPCSPLKPPHSLTLIITWYTHHNWGKTYNYTSHAVSFSFPQLQPSVSSTRQHKLMFRCFCLFSCPLRD